MILEQNPVFVTNFKGSCHGEVAEEIQGISDLGLTKIMGQPVLRFRDGVQYTHLVGQVIIVAMVGGWPMPMIRCDGDPNVWVDYNGSTFTWDALRVSPHHIGFVTYHQTICGVPSLSLDPRDDIKEAKRLETIDASGDDELFAEQIALGGVVKAENDAKI